MKIVLFGGSFDPWTSAHQEIAERLSALYDRVIIIPTAIRYYKYNQQMFSFDERYKAAKEKTQKLKNIKLLDIEKNIDEVWRFIDTLEAVRRIYGLENEYYVAIGSDSLQKFTTWTSWEKILQAAKLLVFNRPGYAENLPDIPFEYLPMENPISSTEIRNKIRNGELTEY
ncbi:MAG: nicotinate-nicotinamide nucleotide adenylyltransferase [Treponema sp.]|nr:nicotinate-nicotinamide nucleotide adenylyltransferase [Treponema sp.]